MGGREGTRSRTKDLCGSSEVGVPETDLSRSDCGQFESKRVESSYSGEVSRKGR